MLFDTASETETTPELIVSFIHSSPNQNHEHEGIESAEYNQLEQSSTTGIIRFDIAGDVYTFEDIYEFIENFVGIVSENVNQTFEFNDSTGTEIFFRFIPEMEYPLLCVLSEQDRVQQIELSLEDIHELSYLFLRLVVVN